jgi:hypothetical protein
MVNTSRRTETGSASGNPSENNSGRNKVEKEPKEEVVTQMTDKDKSKANGIVGLRVQEMGRKR